MQITSYVLIKKNVLETLRMVFKMEQLLLLRNILTTCMQVSAHFHVLISREENNQSQNMFDMSLAAFN